MKPGIWFALLAMAVTAKGAYSLDDPYLWLEDVHGTRPLAWVAEQNARTRTVLTADPRYDESYSAILKILDATDRIPYATLDHGLAFNFWQDAEHPKGIWRRTTTADYKTATPNWDVLLDVGKLASDEASDWVWKGADCDPALGRCLVSLSRGGGDAHVVREFDLATKRFVADGFSLPEAKSDATYADADTVLFATDFGEGSLTTSGYPRIVKQWRRGQPIAQARTIYEGKREDVAASPTVFHGPEGGVALVTRAPSFFEAEYFLLDGQGQPVKLPLPMSASVQGMTGDCLIVSLRDEWDHRGTHYAKGALLAIPLSGFKAGELDLIRMLYTPGPRSSVEQVATGEAAVYVSIFDNVTGRIDVFRRAPDDNFERIALPMPANGATHIVAADDYGGEALFTFESFLKPATLYAYDAGKQDAPAAIKSLPERFDATNLVTEQIEAVSSDGEKIPYFVTRPKGLTEPAPTVLYGYGGFEVSEVPFYSGNFGKLWLEKGGVFVLANIRGGGEFGPAWHQAALQQNRQKAFDDFAAIAADLIRRGITTRKQLGIVGGSNGGLLVSAVMTQHPELLGAVVCQVPLIDMLRYSQIGAGASWIAEYGDPADPKAREWIAKYSPYQNVRAGVKMPPVLFVTATSDDRVTPVHARKMAARMEEQGHDVLFYENTDGGHAAAANHKQSAEIWALTFTYFRRELGLK